MKVTKDFAIKAEKRNMEIEHEIAGLYKSRLPSWIVINRHNDLKTEKIKNDIVIKNYLESVNK